MFRRAPLFFSSMRRLVFLRFLLIVPFLACSHGDAVSRQEDHERFDSPDAAAAFYAMKRGITPGMDVERLYDAARARMASMARYSIPGDAVLGNAGRARTDSASIRTLNSWTQLGPGNIGGRARALLFDPVEPRIMYLAGVSGGVWKTTDAGANWTARGDRLVNLAVNALVIDPRDRFTLYAGTGEGYYREDVRGTALPIRGDGIFVTHDGGETWQQLAQTASNPSFQWVNDLVISAADSRRIYAGTRTGVWRSTDAGTTWTNVLPTTVKGGCTDLALRPATGGDFLFAACGVFEQATVYRNAHAEGSEAWTPVLSDPGMSRTTIAIAPSNPSIVYALAASNNSGPQGMTQNLQAVYRSDQNGDPASWNVVVRYDAADTLARTLLSNPVTALCGSNSWSAMGWHGNVITVDPTNADRVWAGSVDLFRSDDGGKTWGLASYWWIDPANVQFAHADHHVIAFHPGYDGKTNQTIYTANDGGVHRTDNANAAVGYGSGSACRVSSAVAWTSLNHGLGITQFYHGAVFPDGTRFAGGAQDNGTLVGAVSAGIDGWQRGWGGDGAFVAIDPVDPRYVYAESQYGALVRSANGGASFASLNFSSGSSRFLFLTPLALDPNQHTRLWVGGQQMYRSDTSGSSFVVASTPMPAKVSAIAIAPGDSNRVLAGTSAGHILRTASATTALLSTAWTPAQPSTGYVSSLTFDPANANLAYATYAGFGGTHVWRSLDGGATWAPLDGSDSGALPDIPVHSIALDPTRPHRMFLGTDLGVFVSLDDGAHWMVEESGFAAAITEWVTIGAGANGPAVYAFTHGRGVWRAELSLPVTRRRIAR